MRLEVRGDNVSVYEHTRHVIERKARLSFGRAIGEIGDVRIVLRDLNGPRKGVDQACAVYVRLRRGGEVHVEAVEESLHDAVDRALARAERSLQRMLTRQREHGRRSIRIDPPEVASPM